MSAPQPPKQPELLAPAGDLEAGYAALHFGANAVYLGLRKFSARAEAGNFSPEELGEFSAYAHSLSPRRRVFVAVNTLVLNRELGDAAEALEIAAEGAADALIVQDLGVARLAREQVPHLPLHASTQMAIHSLDSARQLAELGFRRVTLARELTLEEIHDIAQHSGLEVESFIHGALCYSYSGLCLYSSHARGRSGNRGRCSYPCRDAFRDLRLGAASPSSGTDDVTDELGGLDGGRGCAEPRNGNAPDPTTHGFPFSMKDLSLADAVPALREAGVASLKIEGRMKSALYVAVTTSLYRALLDGTLTRQHQAEMEADVRTVFSRPWTPLYLRSRANRDVVDSETVGHRGSQIGSVETVNRDSTGLDRLRFRTDRPVERHDGIQVDLPGEGKPYGFAVEHLLLVEPRGTRAVFEAPAGSTVEVGLPTEHPRIPPGSPVYCSSSQAVKHRYKHSRPKPGEFRIRKTLDITATLSAECLRLHAVVRPGPGQAPLAELVREFPDRFEPSRNPAGTETAFRTAFTKLGETPFAPGQLDLTNSGGLFVPVSKLNGWRRDLCAELGVRLDEARARRVEAIVRAATGPVFSVAKSPAEDLRVPLSMRLGRNASPCPNADIQTSSVGRTVSVSRTGMENDGSRCEEIGDSNRAAAPATAWVLKTDRLAHVAAFETGDWQGLDELVVDISVDPLATLVPGLAEAAKHIPGTAKIRLALPVITRAWERDALVLRVRTLHAAGWNRWEASNLSAWQLLRDIAITPADLTADWPLYALNRQAVLQLRALGVSGIILSPEDSLDNMKSLASEFPDMLTAIVFQDTPLFISESCPRANLQGCARLKARSDDDDEPTGCTVPLALTASSGERLTVISRHCRAITLADAPYCVASHADALAAAGIRRLRADFIWRTYEPGDAVAIWRDVRSGRGIPGRRSGNLLRGLL